jgi:hypothetical protein
MPSMREALAVVSDEGLDAMWGRHLAMHHRLGGQGRGAAGRLAARL